MSKELEACFKEIYQEIEYVYADKVNSKANPNWSNDIKHYDNIRDNVLAIQRYLETIEKVKPSEALKCVERIREFFLHRTREMSFQDLRDIEQALLKAEKDKAKIEKLKQENAILHIQLDTFKKIAFKDKSE